LIIGEDKGIGWREEISTELQATVQDLKATRDRLLRVQASIPSSPQEMSQEDIGQPDFPTGMRAVLGVLIADRLDPLIKALLEAAELQPEREEESDLPRSDT